MTRKSVNISHLKVFGYISYVHINAKKKDRFDAKLDKCFFIGYGTDEFVTSSGARTIEKSSGVTA